MAKVLKDFRLRVSKSNGVADGNPTQTYIFRKKGMVHYISGTETPLALSNLLHERTAETRFKLEDALSAVDAARALIKALADMYQRAPANCPKVEVL